MPCGGEAVDVQGNYAAVIFSDGFNRGMFAFVIGGVERLQPAQAFLHATTFGLVLRDFERRIFRGVAGHGVIGRGV